MKFPGRGFTSGDELLFKCENLINWDEGFFSNYC